jgi:hypothetical protein
MNIIEKFIKELQDDEKLYLLNIIIIKALDKI